MRRSPAGGGRRSSRPRAAIGTACLLRWSGPCAGRSPSLRVRGTIEPRGDAFWLTTVLVGAAGSSRLGYAGVLSPGGWQAVADSLVDHTEDGLWDGTLAKDPFLPVGALPVTRTGRVLWTSAERLYSQARWSEADAAYREAQAAGSTR